MAHRSFIQAACTWFFSACPSAKSREPASPRLWGGEECGGLNTHIRRLARSSAAVDNFHSKKLVIRSSHLSRITHFSVLPTSRTLFRSRISPFSRLPVPYFVRGAPAGVTCLTNENRESENSCTRGRTHSHIIRCFRDPFRAFHFAPPLSARKLPLSRNGPPNYNRVPHTSPTHPIIYALSPPQDPY